MDATTKFKERLLAEVKRGVSKFRVATLNGVKYSTLLRWCRQARVSGDYCSTKKLGSRVPRGFKPLNGARTPKTLQMIECLKQGMNQAAVARQFGVAASWVCVLVRRERINIHHD